MTGRTETPALVTSATQLRALGLVLVPAADYDRLVRAEALARALDDWLPQSMVTDPAAAVEAERARQQVLARLRDWRALGGAR